MHDDLGVSPASPVEGGEHVVHTVPGKAHEGAQLGSVPGPSSGLIQAALPIQHLLT